MNDWPEKIQNCSLFCMLVGIFDIIYLLKVLQNQLPRCQFFMDFRFLFWNMWINLTGNFWIHSQVILIFVEWITGQQKSKIVRFFACLWKFLTLFICYTKHKKYKGYSHLTTYMPVLTLQWDMQIHFATKPIQIGSKIAKIYMYKDTGVSLSCLSPWKHRRKYKKYTKY